MPKDTIIHQTYLKQKGVTGTLAQHIQNTGHIYNPEIISCQNLQSKRCLKYETFWKDRLKMTSRGAYYGTFKSNIRYEAYFDQISRRTFRCTLTKLRFSDHNLMIKKGRKQSTKLSFDDRTCKLRFSENFQVTEDEVHFLFDCSWRKYENHRQKLTNDISNLVPHFHNLDSRGKFVFILSNENREISQRFSKFITKMNKERDEALSL